MKELINTIKNWFDENDIDSAVVGFSGGIDSATTAALLHHAGIQVFAVSVRNVGTGSIFIQSSDYPIEDFVALYDGMDDDTFLAPMSGHISNAGKEAALPIIRNAYFYAKAAELREDGYNPVVVGTANFDEAAYLGFWGKASDGAQDYYPISHLHKSEVYALARALGVPKEIIDAVPSGDLQWSGDLNDYKMIGATYDQIEAFAKFVDAPKVKAISQIVDFIHHNIDNPLLFAQSINKNRFKYQLPFPNIHAYPRLEIFRARSYPLISIAAAIYQDKANDHKNLQSF